MFFFLTFTGGEPLLRPDLRIYGRWQSDEACSYLCLGMAVSFMKLYVEFFQQWTPAIMSIILYRATESTYQTVTGIPDMFSKVLANIELLQKANIHVSTRSIITKRNVAEFRKLEKLNYHYADSFFWMLNYLGHRNKGAVFHFRKDFRLKK